MVVLRSMERDSCDTELREVREVVGVIFSHDFGQVVR
jgi:hypothetical protein